MPAHCWSKNIRDLDTLKRVRGVISFYLCHSSFKMALLGARTHLSLWFLPLKKGRAGEWVPEFPSRAGCHQGGTVLPCPIRNMKVSRVPEGRSGAGRTAARGRERAKGTRNLRAALWTPPGSPCTGHWGCLAWGSSQWAPSTHCHSPPHAPPQRLWLARWVRLRGQRWRAFEDD